jgi:transcriptional regulator with XRE-family HTH domain
VSAAGSNDLGARIKALRVAIGLSQEGLESRSRGQVSQPVISAIERGRAGLRTVGTRQGLADAFGISADTLNRYIDGTLSLEATLALRGFSPSPGAIPAATEPADFTAAVDLSFRPDQHSFADARAVSAVLGAVALPDALDLPSIVGVWLDAAATLRKRGATVDLAGLLVAVSVEAARARGGSR